MEIFDGYYYHSCKKFLEISGLWPYLGARRRIISYCIFYTINMTLVVPTFIELVQKFGKDFNVTVENSVSLMFTSACCIKYVVAYTCKNQLKTLFEQIARDWQRIPAGIEKEILAKNTDEGRTLVIFYTVYVLFAWIIYINMPFIPRAVDILFPLNESRPLLKPFFANYVFFDQNNHHYFSCVHLGVVYLTSLFLFAGVDTSFVITVKHTCGLFAIISHRLEALMSDNKKENISNRMNEEALEKYMRDVAMLHNDSIMCCNLLEDTFSISFLVLNSLSVIAAALSVVYVLIIFEDLLKGIRVIVFIFGLLIHLLYINWVGQMIIDSSENIFISVYYSNWYLAPNKIKKVTGIMMVRALFPCTLTAGRITILCIESFGLVRLLIITSLWLLQAKKEWDQLIKAIMSYVTVFLSLL